MNAIAIIPARMDSTRLPGKPMKQLLGMPMIGHCYHRTSLATGFSAVYVATCDRIIADYVESIGGKAIMTSPLHDRASTRTAEALSIIEKQKSQLIDVVAMVQGDEPIISPHTISETLVHFGDEDVQIANIMSKIITKEAFLDHNNVKVVVDSKNNALYFSREPIPSPWQGWEHLPRYMQTGIITFRRDTLVNFSSTSETALEKYESVDLNRVLESGGSIRMVPTPNFTLGVDTEDELRLAEEFLVNDNTVKLYINK